MIQYDKKNIRTWTLLGIAPSIFINGVAEVMRNNTETCLVTADTGRYCGFQKMDECFSDRIFDFGIAEQNMMGIAAGMALEGKQVYATTYAPFLMFRCADQLRHLAGNCNLNIKAIGTAAGFSAATSGYSLMATNDISLARAIPNLTVLSPADCTEAMKMIVEIGKVDGPAYMRFCGLSNLPIVYNDDFDYHIGKANPLLEGSEVAILATGTNVVWESLQAAKIMRNKMGITPTVVDIHTIKPLDEEYISSIDKKHSLIVTVEEHSVIGGLGGAVAECMAANSIKIKQEFIGIKDKEYLIGGRKFMLDQCGLTAQKIAERVESIIK